MHFVVMQINLSTHLQVSKFIYGTNTNVRYVSAHVHYLNYQ